MDYDVPIGADMLQWQFWLDPGHARWISTGPGSALRLRDGKIEPVQWPAVPPEKRLAQDWTRIFEGREGRLWVLEFGYLHLREGGTWRTYPTPFPAAVLPRPSFLFEDREGTLWIGGDGGLIQATPTAVRALVPEGVQAGHHRLHAGPGSGRPGVGDDAVGSLLVRARRLHSAVGQCRGGRRAG